LELRDEMEKMRLKHIKELKELRQEIEEAKNTRDMKLQRELTDEINKVNKKLEMLENEKEKLKKAAPSTIPANLARRKGLFKDYYWVCIGVGCDHETRKSGDYTCKRCKLVQRNTKY